MAYLNIGRGSLSASAVGGIVLFKHCQSVCRFGGIVPYCCKKSFGGIGASVLSRLKIWMLDGVGLVGFLFQGKKAVFYNIFPIIFPAFIPAIYLVYPGCAKTMFCVPVCWLCWYRHG